MNNRITEDMNIAIPSLGRYNARYLVHEQIPERWHDRCFYVVTPEEYEAYKKRLVGTAVSIKVCSQQGIAQARLHAMANAHYEKVLMLDDDIRFFNRRTGEPGMENRLEKAGVTERDTMLQSVASWLQSYWHVGISHREGNNRLDAPYTFNKRCTRAVGFQRDAYLNNPPTLGIMEDFDVTLQLLQQGHPYLVLTHWAQDQQGGTQATGGCSVYRTHAAQEQAARALAAKFPEFVKLRQKQTKSGLKESIDVTVYWKKAAESSVLTTNEEN